MRVEEPLSFSLMHLGRGGDVTCRCEAGEIKLPIEMQAGGEFSVWVRGSRLAPPAGKQRRLRKEERELVLERLQAWLDANGKTRWSIER